MARHTRLLSRFTTHWRVWGFHKLEWRVVSPMAPLEIFSGRREAISIAGRDGRDYAEAMTSPAVLTAPAVPTPPPATLFALFTGFLQVALCSFRGPFAWAPRALVFHRGLPK